MKKDNKLLLIYTLIFSIINIFLCLFIFLALISIKEHPNNKVNKLAFNVVFIILFIIWIVMIVTSILNIVFITLILNKGKLQFIRTVGWLSLSGFFTIICGILILRKNKKIKNE